MKTPPLMNPLSKIFILTLSLIFTFGSYAEVTQTNAPPSNVAQKEVTEIEVEVEVPVVQEAELVEESKAEQGLDEAKKLAKLLEEQITLANKLAELNKKEAMLKQTTKQAEDKVVADLLKEKLMAEYALVDLKSKILIAEAAVRKVMDEDALKKKYAKELAELAELKFKATLAAELQNLQDQPDLFRMNTAKIRAMTAKFESDTENFERVRKALAQADKKKADAIKQLKKPYNPADGGTLVISDRRIDFNGPVTSNLADLVSDKINFYNNRDETLPIFIVIDSSPGGSVAAGFKILRAMDSSRAPVYVVVKSFAASMAAGITTLAEKSFCYPTANILHHQISWGGGGNLTEQREVLEDISTNWWTLLADPVAKKMGLNDAEEFIDLMYENTKTGDWTEFGHPAQKLKWVDHVVNKIIETAIVEEPVEQPSLFAILFGQDGKAVSVDPAEYPDAKIIVPLMHPKDAYYLYNPDRKFIRPDGRVIGDKR